MAISYSVNVCMTLYALHLSNDDGFCAGIVGILGLGGGITSFK
jgi:hypothetical protein